MIITGTAYRAAFGAGQTPAVNPLLWILPIGATDLTVECDMSIAIGTAVLVRGLTGDVSATCVIPTQYERWLIVRPYLGVCLTGNTVTGIGIYQVSVDSGLQPWVPVL